MCGVTHKAVRIQMQVARTGATSTPTKAMETHTATSLAMMARDETVIPENSFGAGNQVYGYTRRGGFQLLGEGVWA
jgi:hypothetical protein